MGAFKPCYWCGNQFQHYALTRDHLVPQWALRIFPELRDSPANIAKSCAKDNVRKGGMPPALYAEVRLDKYRRDVECRRWGQLQQQLNVSSFLSDDRKALRAYVLEEMRRPYKPPFYEAEPESEGSKLARISRLLDRKPEKIRCSVSAGKVDGLERWERLNNLVHDRLPESPRAKRALVAPSLEAFVGGEPTRTDGEAG